MRAAGATKTTRGASTLSGPQNPETANRHLRRDVQAGDIVSLRCGIRALAVKRDYVADRYPLELSRRSMVHQDRERPWISVYGGKLTSYRATSVKLMNKIRGSLPERDWTLSPIASRHIPARTITR